MAGIGNHPYLVHYVLDRGRNAGSCRPGVVVRDWVGSQNLQVFTDGENDGLGDAPVLQASSVAHSETATPNTWHHARECDAATAAQGTAEKASAAADDTPEPMTDTPFPAPAVDPSPPQSGSGPSDSSGTASDSSPAKDETGAGSDSPDPLTAHTVANPVGQPTAGELAGGVA